MSKHQAFSINTLMKYLAALTERVERKITALLPEKIALILDGWTCGSTHYLGVFASFPSDSKDSYEMRLLTLSPMGDECRLDASEHHKFFSYILGLYCKTWHNVVCINWRQCKHKQVYCKQD